jgi:ABC-type phosphate/phosphonate transport system permease subunit
VDLVGAGRWQVIRYAVMPQVLPVVVGRSFYAFDVNLRAAIALGVYGGGGVGFELQLAMKVLRYADAFALILLIILLITGMERVSDAVRRLSPAAGSSQVSTAFTHMPNPLILTNARIVTPSEIIEDPS